MLTRAGLKARTGSAASVLALVVWTIFAVTVVGAAPARADLLDDEPSVVATPKPATVPAPSQDKPPKATKKTKTNKHAADANTAPSAGPEDQAGADPAAAPGGGKTDAEESEPRLSAPTPHAKQGGNMVVIPPKNATDGDAKPRTRQKKGGKPEAEPVHFESKGGLKGLRAKGMIELEQDVVVTQGDMRLEAQHAQIFFVEKTAKTAAAGNSGGLQRVVAEGMPVKINGIDANSGEKFRAYGNQAVYLSAERTVVIEGNARLWRGEDSVIRSNKITYEMNSGWIRADRVSGEVQPGDTAAPARPATTPKPNPNDDEEPKLKGSQKSDPKVEKGAASKVPAEQELQPAAPANSPPTPGPTADSSRRPGTALNQELGHQLAKPQGKQPSSDPVGGSSTPTNGSTGDQNAKEKAP